MSRSSGTGAAGSLSDAIRAIALTKTYGEGSKPIVALDEVDLTVGRGEFIAVMGPSGSGKSTLLQLLGALDIPDAGEVTLMGERLSDCSLKDLTLIRRTLVGFVFQFFNLVNHLTVEENIALPALLSGMDSRCREARVDELVDRMELNDKRARLPAELSGGEKQRAAIARALVNNPPILLADEPTGNLDRRSGRVLMNHLRDLNALGQTIVVVSHDPEMASHGERVLMMRDGRFIGEMTPTGPGDQRSVLTTLLSLDL